MSMVPEAPRAGGYFTVGTLACRDDRRHAHSPILGLVLRPGTTQGLILCEEKLINSFFSPKYYGFFHTKSISNVFQHIRPSFGQCLYRGLITE